MTDTKEIIETATPNIDAFFGKLTEAADMVTQKLVAVAPEAAEAILTLVQFKGIFVLTASAVGVTVSACIAYRAGRLFAAYAGKKDWEDYPLQIISGGAVCAMAGIFFLALLFQEFFSFYNWLSAFYPAGAVTLKALEAVGVSL